MESAIIITLASMAAKLSDPLFILAIPVGLFLAFRGMWLIAYIVFVLITAVNVAMVWDWWAQLGMATDVRVQAALWQLVIWSLWGAVTIGIGALARRLIKRTPVAT